jgi:hypothetical protein
MVVPRAKGDHSTTMLYQRQRRYSTTLTSYLHLEQEKTKARIAGHGWDNYMRSRDEHGNVWTGVVEKGPGGHVRCRLKDQSGRNLTGVSDAGTWTFRDDEGNIWKGVTG